MNEPPPLHDQRDDAVLVGVIQNISRLRTMLDLYVYDDGILVAKGSVKGAAIRGAFAGTGIPA